MSESPSQKRVVIVPNPVSLAASVAARFLRRLAEGLSDGQVVHVVLTGGTIPTAILRAVGMQPARTTVDWSRVHFWWGADRFVPRDDDARNEKTARAVLLDRLDVPAGNLHTVPSPDDGTDLDESVEAYAAELARFGEGDRPWPSFDVCLLDVATDAHIAALFPDRPEIQVTGRSVVAVRDAPMPPADRITLTRPVLNSSREVWLVVTGADKASALGLVLAGASYEGVPAAGAKGRERTLLFVDRAAAADVPAELIEPED